MNLTEFVTDAATTRILTQILGQSLAYGMLVHFNHATISSSKGI